MQSRSMITTLHNIFCEGRCAQCGVDACGPHCGQATLPPIQDVLGALEDLDDADPELIDDLCQHHRDERQQDIGEGHRIRRSCRVA